MSNAVDLDDLADIVKQRESGLRGLHARHATRLFRFIVRAVSCLDGARLAMCVLTTFGSAGRVRSWALSRLATQAQREQLSVRSGGAHCALPYSHRFSAELAHCSAGGQVTLDVEGVVDGGVGGEKLLRGSRRLEALHAPLPLSHRQM